MSNRNDDLWDDVNALVYSWDLNMYIRKYCSYPEQETCMREEKPSKIIRPCKIMAQQVSWTSVGFELPTFYGLTLTFLTVTSTFSTALTLYASMLPTVHIMRSHALKSAAHYSISLECPQYHTVIKIPDFLIKNQNSIIAQSGSIPARGRHPLW